MTILAIFIYSLTGFVLAKIINGRFDFLNEINSGNDIILVIIFWPFVLIIIALALLWMGLSKLLWFLWNKI